MEINLNVTFGMAPSMTATIRALLAAPLREKECETESENDRPSSSEEPEPEREPKTKKVATKPKSATASKTEATQEPETPVSEPMPSAAPSASGSEPASAPEAVPAPEYKEKPEDVLPLLRERFAIPKNKEDRDDQQQALAKELNRAVVSVIREVTKNTGAKSISDLRTDADRREFIRMALLITYDVGTGKFKTMPF